MEICDKCPALMFTSELNLHFFELAVPPEMVCGEFLHQCSGKTLSQNEQEGDDDVMITLIIVQLRVFLQHTQDDVDQLLLQPHPLLIRHTCTQPATVYIAITAIFGNEETSADCFSNTRATETIGSEIKRI